VGLGKVLPVGRRLEQAGRVAFAAVAAAALACAAGAARAQDGPAPPVPISGATTIVETIRTPGPHAKLSCAGAVFVEVPVTEGITLYTALLTNAKEHFTATFPAAFAIEPPYPRDRWVVDSGPGRTAVFNAPTGEHQMVVDSATTLDGCKSVRASMEGWKLLRVTGSTQPSPSH
jgi:hypothetical protein